MTTPSPPPGTGGTLVEQLEQAAKRAEFLAFLLKNGACPARIDTTSIELEVEASDLRSRAARVREMQAANLTAGGRYVFLELCGPLSPTEPAATPTRDERRWTGRHHWEALPGTGWQCSCGSLRRGDGTTKQTNSFEYRTPPARKWTSQEPPCGAGRDATPTEKGGAR